MVTALILSAFSFAPLMASVPAEAVSTVQDRAAPGAPDSTAPEPIDWRSAEIGILENQTQLTFPERFVKAGESYFSPDGTRIVFQAVEVPAEGHEPDEFYAMFVADLVRGDAPKWRLENIRRISPAGSANTCGWFSPVDPNRVIFGSTIGAPSAGAPPGYQRGTNRYRWSFPPEMRIVTVDLTALPVPAPRRESSAIDVPASALTTLEGDGHSYAAEGSLSTDGRWLLYTSLATNDGDLYLRDLLSTTAIPLVSAPGYDGGPFFSPDGNRICYRSDRAGNNLLQVYVADLERDDTGAICGVRQEFAVTANNDVNWCPFWHPAGRHLVYATSAMGHRNYEVFMIDAASDDRATPPQRRYGTAPRRVTHADGADVLPAFDSTGRLFMWTSQRASDRSSQLWIADFVMPLEPLRQDATPPRAPGGRDAVRPSR